MKKLFISLKYIILALFVCFLFISVSAHPLSVYADAADASDTSQNALKVAFSIVPGISEIDQYGNHTGLMFDYLNEISNYTGWTYDYIEVSDGETLINNFISGQYDLMGGVFYAPAYEQYFAYPDYNMGSSSALLLCRRDDERIKGYDLSSINGMTIGVNKNATAKINYMIEFLENNNLNCNIRYYTYEEISVTGNLHERLLNGEVDILLGNELELGSDFRMVASFDAQPYYIVTRADDTKHLDELNKALAYILESTPTFADEVNRKNFPDIQMIDIQLNADELKYIAEKKTVTVAVPSPWHPMYCIGNSFDQHNGILPDVLKLVSEYTGLEFEFILTDTYAQSIEMVLSGNADMLGTYIGGTEADVLGEFALSRSYVSLSNVILKYKSVDFPHAGLTCGVLKGRSLPAEFEAKSVYYYDTIHEMVAAANNHEVDFIYGISALIEQEMQSHRYVNVIPLSYTGNNTSVSFALPQPAEPELLTILNKAVCNIPSGQLTSILNRNLVSMGYSSLSLIDLIYDKPVVYAIVLLCIIVFIIIVGIAIAKNRMKNALIQSRLEAAEAKSTAKSIFLSRMSHEIRTPMNAIVGLADLACMEPDIPEAVETKLTKLRSSSHYLLALINDILDMSRIENEKMILESNNFSLRAVIRELEEMMSNQAEQKGLRFVVRYDSEHDWIVSDLIRLRQILTNLLSNAIKFTDKGGTVALYAQELSADDKKVKYRFAVTDTGIGILPEDQQRIFASFEQVSYSASQSEGTGLGLPISRSIARMMGGDLEVKSSPDNGSEFYMILEFLQGVPDENEKETKAPSQNSLKEMDVLLVEDNDLNAEIAKELLIKHGMHVYRATNGQQAIDMFVKSPVGTYQIILMDILMPIKDGYQATEEIRASGRTDADVPIIAMTANSFKEDKERARAAGMNDFIPKPVDFARLISILNELLG